MDDCGLTMLVENMRLDQLEDSMQARRGDSKAQDFQDTRAAVDIMNGKKP